MHNAGAGLYLRQRIAVAAAQAGARHGFHVASTRAKLTIPAPAVEYLGRTLWPVGLRPKHEVPLHVSPLDFPHSAHLASVAVASALALRAVLAQAWRKRSRSYKRRGTLPSPPLLAAAAAPAASTSGPAVLPAMLALYLALLLPSSGIIQHGYANAGADRYSYFPAMILVPATFALLVRAEAAAVGGARAGPLFPPPIAVVYAGVAAVILAFAWATARQTEVWRDNRAFFEHEFRTTTGAPAHARTHARTLACSSLRLEVVSASSLYEVLHSLPGSPRVFAIRSQYCWSWLCRRQGGAAERPGAHSPQPRAARRGARGVPKGAAESLRRGPA